MTHDEQLIAQWKEHNEVTVIPHEEPTYKPHEGPLIPTASRLIYFTEDEEVVYSALPTRRSVVRPIIDETMLNYG